MLPYNENPWRCSLLVLVTGLCLFDHVHSLPNRQSFDVNDSRCLMVRGGATRERRDINVAASNVADLNRINNDKTKRKKKRAVLNFEGVFAHNTPPLPDASLRQVLDFFQDSEHRNLVLKGGANPTQQVPATPELYQQWKEQSEIVQSVPPSANDPILAVTSTVPLLPGLSIEAVSYLGCKFLQNPRTLLPVYEFTLIKDEYVPRGKKPMVWIFSQVTGIKSGKNVKQRSTTKNNNNRKARGTSNYDASANRKTHGLSRIFMESYSSSGIRDDRTGDFQKDSNRHLVVHYFGFIKVSCNIPSHVVGMLPVSKDKIEAKVGKAMSKQLEAEGVSSLEKLHAAFEAWVRR